jgi:hypothetical protein
MTGVNPPDSGQQLAIGDLARAPAVIATRKSRTARR